MKLIACILCVFVLGLSSKPLLSEVLNVWQVETAAVSGSCTCCEDGGKCCCDKDENNNEKHECKGSCSCSFHTSSPYTVTHFQENKTTVPSIKIQSAYFSLYTFSLAPVIWHPPQMV